jgi:hypothetical protein
MYIDVNHVVLSNQSALNKDIIIVVFVDDPPNSRQAADRTRLLSSGMSWQSVGNESGIARRSVNYVVRVLLGM